MSRTPFAFALVAVAACLPALGGCTRTSDGTVVVRKPPAVASLLPSWMPGHRMQAPPAPAVFPPEPPRRSAAPGPGTRAAARAELRCAPADGQRVRVVCR